MEALTISGAVAQAEKEFNKSLRYVEELLLCRCGSDMLTQELFPDLKEVTESFGAYCAARNHLKGFRLNDPDVTVVAVGDGGTPRTAATFAYRSAWKCYSVDPALGKPKWTENTHGIRRLTCIKNRIENVSINARRAIIVAVHSHANLLSSIASINGADEIAVIAIPCCVPLELGWEPDISYDDPGILSPKRKVNIWSNALRTRPAT